MVPRTSFTPGAQPPVLLTFSPYVNEVRAQVTEDNSNQMTFAPIQSPEATRSQKAHTRYKAKWEKRKAAARELELIKVESITSDVENLRQDFIKYVNAQTHKDFRVELKHTLVVQQQRRAEELKAFPMLTKLFEEIVSVKPLSQGHLYALERNQQIEAAARALESIDAKSLRPDVDNLRQAYIDYVKARTHNNARGDLKDALIPQRQKHAKGLEAFPTLTKLMDEIVSVKPDRMQTLNQGHITSSMTPSGMTQQDKQSDSKASNAHGKRKRADSRESRVPKKHKAQG